MKIILSLILITCSYAESYLQDFNNDGVITVLGFGDSLAWGVGDGVQPGNGSVFPITNGSLGFLKRIREYTGLKTVNGGFPGEIFTDNGFKRFPRVLQSSSADVVVIFDGNNDAGFQVSSNNFKAKMQMVINIASLYNARVILVTLPQTCCEHSGRGIFIDSLNNVMKYQVNINELRVADVNRAWKTTCNDTDNCDLFNLPEGLHPNIKGYEVISEVILAALYDINIFSSSGATDLASVIGKDPSQIIVKPE